MPVTLLSTAALIVALALVVLPSLYTWYNVVAFWNPYEATGNMTVYVVNQDKGTVSEEDIPALVQALCRGDGRQGSISGFVTLNEEDCEKIYRLMI